jgi:predicted TIM-barrel fold metal-dependent hydrolase
MPIGKQKIIDGHSHLGYAFAQRESGMFSAPLAEDFVAVMDEHGVDIACTETTHYQGTHGHPYDPDYSEANRQIAQESRKFPDRMIPFLRLNPNFQDRIVDQLKRGFEEQGMKGMGEIHPLCDHFQVNDLKLLEPMMRACADYKWPIHWHSGNYPTGEAALYAPLLEAWPEVNHVLGHINYPFVEDCVALAKRYKNVYFETAGNGTSEFIRWLIDNVGAERVIYGDDMPFSYPSDVMDKMRYQPGVSDHDKALMLGGNMARLLGMEVMA